MEFLSALASYGIVLLIFAAVGAVAIFLGITLRKRKNRMENFVEKEEETKSGDLTEKTKGKER